MTSAIPLPVKYALKISVEATDTEDEAVLLDVETTTPVGSFHAGDLIWPPALQPDGLVYVPPYLYNESMTVKSVMHVVSKAPTGGIPNLRHQVNVVLQHPYEN